MNSRPLHRDLAGRKGWQDMFSVLNEKNMQPRILYPARLSFRIEGEIKSFQDRHLKPRHLKAFKDFMKSPQPISFSMGQHWEPFPEDQEQDRDVHSHHCYSI